MKSLDTPLDEDYIEPDNNSESNSNEKIQILNHNSIFYKGLFGMILCILPGAILGIVLIKISLDQAKKARKDIDSSPSNFSSSSIKRVKKGQLMARIGLGLFIAEILAIGIFLT